VTPSLSATQSFGELGEPSYPEPEDEIDNLPSSSSYNDSGSGNDDYGGDDDW